MKRNIKVERKYGKVISINVNIKKKYGAVSYNIITLAHYFPIMTLGHQFQSRDKKLAISYRAVSYNIITVTHLLQIMILGHPH